MLSGKVSLLGTLWAIHIMQYVSREATNAVRAIFVGGRDVVSDSAGHSSRGTPNGSYRRTVAYLSHRGHASGSRSSQQVTFIKVP